MKPKVLIVRGGIRDASRYNYRNHEGFFEDAFRILGYEVVHYGKTAPGTKPGPYDKSPNVQAVVRQVQPAFCLGVELNDPIHLARVRGVPRVAYVCDIHRLKDVSLIRGVDLLIVRAKAFESWVRKMPSGNTIRNVVWVPFSVNWNDVASAPEPAKRDPLVIFAGGHRREPWPCRLDAMNALSKAGLLSKRSTTAVGDRRLGLNYFATLKTALFGLACSTRWKLNPAKHFEIPACGTVLLTDGSPGMERILPDHLYLKYTPRTVVDIVKKFLSDPARMEEARAMGKESAEYIRTHHTNEVRARELMDVLRSSGVV